MSELQELLKEATAIRKELRFLSQRMDRICLIIGRATMMYELAESWQIERTLELYKGEYVEIHLRIKDLKFKLKNINLVKEMTE